jgi:hypothetical protein
MPEITAETPTKEFTIAGLTIPVAQPYVEGHALTENEATALNGLLAENLRNNFAARVKKAQEALKTGEELNVPELIEQFQKYAGEYEFGLRRANGTGTTQPKDPVAREALNMARDVIRGALKDSGYNLKEVGAAKIQELAEDLVQRDPRFTAAAEESIARVKALSAGGLDFSGVGSAAPAAEEAAATE